jgi:diadenosine tetraphosphatase ApaH/serine/threonine PP2A family protein phosphatase
MRVLIVSDVHANLVALKAVLGACPPVDAVWNLGDTVGYGPQPAACLDRLRERGAEPSLAGNHDLACIGAVDLAEFNPVARAAAAWTASRLSREHRAYLAALPGLTTVEGCTLAHASPRDPVWEYVVDATAATANLRAVETALCVVGHSHVALVATLRPGDRVARLRPLRDGETVDLADGRHLVNPGSVGQPRDRDPRAAYALLDTGRGALTAHRVAYDVAATQRQMAAASLPPSLIARLALGV